MRYNECTEELLSRIVSLHQSGMSLREVSKKMRLPKTTVYRWYCNFAEENGIDMREKKKKIDPKRVTGIVAPSEPMPSQEKVVQETDAQKIARLERELSDARLRADLFEEIINVAEQRFNISITKKAGTKR